jgi:hypothetical protein
LRFPVVETTGYKEGIEGEAEEIASKIISGRPGAPQRFVR